MATLRQYVDAIRNVNTIPQGSTGTENFDGWIYGEEINPKLDGLKGVEQYEQMRDTDAQVKASLLSIELPIISASWDVEPASEQPVDIEAADFVKENILRNPNFTWGSKLREILRYLQYGFQLFEKVYELRDGKYYLKNLAYRRSKTIDQFKVKDGLLFEVVQRAYKDFGGFGEMTIPNENILLFVNDQEGGNYRGKSILRAAWHNWNYKKSLIKFDAIKHNRQSVGIPKIKPPATVRNQDETTARKVAETLKAHEKGYVYEPDGWSVEYMDMKAGTTSMPIESVKYHNSEIVANVLAQFLDLGKTESGSRAVGVTLRDMFLGALQANVDYIEEIINEGIEGRQLIRELVDYNFNVKEYPKLKAGKVSNVDTVMFSTALRNLSQAGFSFSDVETQNKIRDIMDLPELKIQESSEGENATTDEPRFLNGAQIASLITIVQNVTSHQIPRDTGIEVMMMAFQIPRKVADKILGIAGKGKKPLTEKIINNAIASEHHSCGHVHYQEGPFWRGLTELEKSINLEQTDSTLKDYETQAQKTGDKWRGRMINAMVTTGVAMLSRAKNKDIDTFLNEVYAKEIPLKSNLRSDLTKDMRQVDKFSRSQILSELKTAGFDIKDKESTSESKKIVAPLVVLAVKTMTDTMKKQWQEEVVRQKLQIDSGALAGVNSKALSDGLLKLSKNPFRSDIRKTVRQTFGSARGAEASAILKGNEQEVKITRSEIMDENVCSECQSIDGEEFDMNDPLYNETMGGGYVNCLGSSEQCRGINIYERVE